MAKKSPPIPLETGSIKPRVAFAAIAASTALPPRFKISTPTCVAAGTLVQTIPCRARTSDRVAKFFPVMRSIWASSRRLTINRASSAKVGGLIQRISHTNAFRLKSALEFYSPIVFDCWVRMRMSSDDQKAIGLILVCVGFLFFLIGLAARLKENFHSRAEISTAGFTAAAIMAGLGVIVFLFSWRKKQGCKLGLSLV